MSLARIAATGFTINAPDNDCGDVVTVARMRLFSPQ